MTSYAIYLLKKVKPLIFCIGSLSVLTTSAQFPTQSLFYRAQLLEYKTLVNQSSRIIRDATGKPGFIVKPALIYFPIQCNPEHSIVRSMWTKGEDFFTAMKWDEAANIYQMCIEQDSALCDAYF